MPTRRKTDQYDVFFVGFAMVSRLVAGSARYTLRISDVAAMCSRTAIIFGSIAIATPSRAHAAPRGA